MADCLAGNFVVIKATRQKHSQCQRTFLSKPLKNREIKFPDDFIAVAI
jgi:hypothetical protein